MILGIFSNQLGAVFGVIGLTDAEIVSGAVCCQRMPLQTVLEHRYRTALNPDPFRSGATSSSRQVTGRFKPTTLPAPAPITQAVNQVGPDPEALAS
jgi:hypothetical protein